MRLDTWLLQPKRLSLTFLVIFKMITMKLHKYIPAIFTFYLLTGSLFVTTGVHCQSVDETKFDNINFYESQFTNGKLYLKWYSVGNKPAPHFTTFRYDNGKPSEATALTALYKVKDSTFYVFSDDKPPVINPDGTTQYFIVPHDTLKVSGKPSSAAMITSTGSRYFTNATATRQQKMAGIRVLWTFSSTKYISRFELLRSEIRESEYTLIATLTANDTVFNDLNIIADKVYYYKLRAIPSEGNKPIYSSRFFGTGYNPAPPVTPYIKHAFAVKNGAVLHVKVADTEVKGIRIYRNNPGMQLTDTTGVLNDMNDKLVAVSDLLPVPDSMVVVYYDTVAHLSGRKLYTYAAKAESSSFIESNFSDFVGVKPVNTIPPGEPVSVTAYEEEGTVRLFWEAPVIDRNYITGYDLERLEGNLAAPASRTLLHTGVNYFTDSTVIAGKVYTYKIKSSGYDGLVSQDAVLATITLNNNVIVPAAPFALSGFPTDEGVYLQWSETRYGGLASVRVYRYSTGSKPLRIAELPPDAAEYTDSTIKKAESADPAQAAASTTTETIYYVTTVNASGQESEPSEELFINL